MKHTRMARWGALAVAACLAVSSMPVFADGEKQITVQYLAGQWVLNSCKNSQTNRFYP